MPVPSISAAQLFTPAPSGVGPNGFVPNVPPSGTWLAIMLQTAATVQLPTTAWQPGGPERTILAVQAVSFAQADARISIMAQGAFLDTAASGTVSYVTVDGDAVTVPVTPDPSLPSQNPTGALGWLDVLTQSVYDVFRLAATPATGPLALANLGNSTVGPFNAGTYHASNPQTGATYINQTTFSVPPSAIGGSGGQVAGVTPGLVSTIIITAAPHGLTVGETVFLQISQATGISGLSNMFALVAAVTSTTFQVAVGSSGTWVSGGTVFLCTTTNMQADKLGTAGNAAPNAVTVAITQNASVFIDNVVAWSGANFESNQALASRARLSLAAASPDGPSDAYVFFAETAAQLLPLQAQPYTLTNGPVVANEFANPVTGIVTVVVASTSPVSTVLGANVTPGVSQLPIVGVSNANPAVINCSGPTSLQPSQSMTVSISGVLGTAGVNGTFLGTYVTSTSFSIPVDTTSAGTYTGGGQVEGGDLGQIDQLLQRNVVPDGIVGAITESALAFPVTILATVLVPVAFVSAYRIAATTQLQNLLANYPIGGFAGINKVQLDDVIGALEEAGVFTQGGVSQVRQIQALTINGSTADLPFPSNQYQALLSSGTTINVIGV